MRNAAGKAPMAGKNADVCGTSILLWELTLSTRTARRLSPPAALWPNDTHETDLPEQLIAQGRVHPESVESMRAMYARLYAGEKHAEGTFQLRYDADSEYAWVHIQYTVLPDGDGRPGTAVGVAADVSEEVRTRRRYESEARMLEVFSRNARTTAILDTDARAVISVHGMDAGEAARLERRSFDELLAVMAGAVKEDAEAKRFYQTLSADAVRRRLDRGVDSRAYEYLRLMADGGERWVCDEAHYLRDPDTGHRMVFLSQRDIDAEKRRGDELVRAAETDQLTGLLNHAATLSHIREYLAGEGASSEHAMFMVDLDNFKLVNDRLGHPYGDTLLSRAATALREAFRSTDVVGRVGGDEFLALMKHVPSLSGARRKAEELVQTLQFSCGPAGEETALTASVGVALCGKGHGEFDELYHQADEALYEAKRAGRQQFFVFGGGSAEKPAPSAEAPAVMSGPVQLRTLLEYMDGGVMVIEVGQKAHVAYVSPSLLRRFRRSREDAGNTGERVAQFVDPEDREVLGIALQETAESGEPFDLFIRVREKDGQAGWRHLRGARMPVEDGVPTRILCMVLDATERKQREERVRLAEQRFRTAVELTGAMIWEVDLATRTLYQTEEVSRAVGMEGTVFPDAPESLLRSGAIHPDSAEETRRMYAFLYAGDDGHAFTLRTKDGAEGWVWLRVRFRLMRDGTGAPYRAIGVVEKRPNVESELRSFSEERRFQSLMTSSIFGAARIDLTRGVVREYHLNGKRGDRCEYDVLLERALSHIPDPAEREMMRVRLERERLIDSFREGNGWMSWEFQYLSDGEARYMNVVVNLLRHPVSDGVFAFVYLRDIHARRLWELAAERAGSAVERDAATLLYTPDALRAMVAAAPEGKLRAMALFELSNLRQLRAAYDAPTVQRLLFVIGRAFRAILTGSAIAGHMGEGTIAVFYSDVRTEDWVRARCESMRDRLRTVVRQSAGDRAEMQLACGLAFSDRAKPDFARMLRQAETACQASIVKDNLPVTIYSGAFVPEDNEDDGFAERPTALLAGPQDALAAARAALAFEFDLREARTAEEARRLAEGCALIVDGLDGGAAERADAPVIALVADTAQAQQAIARGAADALRADTPLELWRARARNAASGARAEWLARINRQYELRFQQESSEAQAAELDPLTGLYNKQAFLRRVREALDLRPGRKYMIARWDIDNFKMFNDMLSVEAGDRLLVDMAAAIRSLAGAESICARLDSDHFVDFLPVGEGDPAAPFLKAFEWFASYPVEFRLSGRLGLYMIDDPSLDVGIMCDRALLALRSVKGNYNQRIAYYDDEMRAQLVEEQQLVGEMTSALETGQFEVWFQPQYDYESGQMVSAEALVRWKHPTRGLIPPSRFIPLFERNGFISSLDAYVWERCCQYMRTWQNQMQKLVPVAVAVNISRMDIYDPLLPQRLSELVQKYDLPPSFLKLEITETAYMENPQRLIETVRQLQSLGFTLEMDDFGSGYSSLNTLKDVPVDVLKLDTKFLSRCEDDARGGNILSSVVRMAHWLKLPIIAEGVETKEQADYLKSLGCYYMQGYYFARPMPAAEFERLLIETPLGSTNRYVGTDLGGMSAFWDSSAQAALLFNSFVGGAAIMEYYSGNLETLRCNDAFYDIVGLSRGAHEDALLRVLEHVEEGYRQEAQRLLESAEVESKEFSMEIQVDVGEQKGRWLLCRGRMIAKNYEHRLFYIAVEDIGRYKTTTK